MNIIKFSNGKYGVREWSWNIWDGLGWVFALNKSGSWAKKSADWVQEFDTLEYAEEVFEDMKNRENISKDQGVRLRG